MTEWYIIIPVVAVLVQGMIAIFIAWYGQKRLAQKRFLTEKWWDEARSLYYDISRICQDILNCMSDIPNALSIYGTDLHPLTGIYVLMKVVNIDWEWAFQLEDATESERSQIKIFDELIHLDRFDKLYNRLRGMLGRVAIFGSEEIYEMFNTLFRISNFYALSLTDRINMQITESSMKTGSPAESGAFEILNELSQMIGYMGKEVIAFPETLDIESVVNSFSDTLDQMHKQMKKELSKGFES